MKSDVVKLVTFRLGQDLFAADVQSVERVLRYAAPSAVPDMPAWIAGVLDHRGKVIPVVDMRLRVALTDAPTNADTRMLLLNSTDGWVAAIVDTVLEVVAVPAGAIAPPPAMFRGLAAQFVRGIARVKDQLIVVLEVDRILASSDRIVLENALGATASVARG